MNRGLSRKVLTILYMVVCFAAVADAQRTDTLENKTRNSLTGYFKKYPQEKIFLHTDAGLYACGQTIWYKAYSIAYGKPSELSGVIDVQLLDSSGNVLIKNKLQLKNGLAHGNIELPDSLHSGWYQLIGFTAWMMNFSQESFYHQKIYIQNLTEATADPKRGDNRKKYHIAFFPEGGDLVEGNLCYIAFKATDENGMPVKAEGEVLAYDKKVIAKIITVHDRMGMFSIEGYAGKKNTAILRFPDNTVQAVDLPAFKKNGITLQVNGLPPNSVEIKIAFNGSRQQYGNVVLAAYQNSGIINTYPCS